MEQASKEAVLATAETIEVDLKGGGTAGVRPLGRTRTGRVMSVAGVTDVAAIVAGRNDGEGAVFMEYVVRASVITFAGGTLQLRTERHPKLGVILCEDLYDALH